MFSAEDQQIEICLLKSNLEEIGNDLVVQRSAIPALEDENKKKYNDTMTELRVVRSLNTEIEKLKQDNSLTAKRAQLKRQCDELFQRVEAARKYRDELTDALKHENSEIELHIRKYEDSLQEKADRFRITRGFYDEAAINREIRNVNNVIVELEQVVGQKQSLVDDLKKQAEIIRPEVPENILEISGKRDLDEKVQALTKQFEALSCKRQLAIL